MANTEYLYGGKPYSLTPIYTTQIGYATPSQIGTSVDARTANQVKEVSEHLNSGIKIVEVGGHDPGVFDSIPKDHLKELNRVAKLTGAELTFHGPMIDPSGIGQHGWDKLSQKAAENQLWNAIERSHDLNPDGNINVTFHASTVNLPPAQMEIKEGEKIKPISRILVNKASGEITQIKEEEKYFGGGGKPVPFDPVKETDEKNKDIWMSTVSNLNFASQRGENDIRNAFHIIERNPLYKKSDKELEQIKETNPQEYKDAMGAKKELSQELQHGKLYLLEAARSTKALFNQVYKEASDDEKKNLDAYSKKIMPFIDKPNEIKEEQLQDFAKNVEEGINILTNLKQPKIFTPLKNFAVEKSAETFGNIAWNAYKKFESTAPIISIENHPAYASLLTTGDELKEVIVAARKQFVENATKDKEKPISRGEAEEQAKKLIGATWDVGHINMLKRYGYTDKELIKQTETISPYVKKVHLSDNFGYEHTELPMGMGNVPIKEMMKKLGEKGFEGPKVVEALNWWQHFSPGGKVNPPFVSTLQAFGAEMYSGGPAWSQVYGGAPGGYFSGYGTILPDQHFQTYGAGFSALPIELGGQVQSKESKFSGTPMS